MSVSCEQATQIARGHFDMTGEGAEELRVATEVDRRSNGEFCWLVTITARYGGKWSFERLWVEQERGSVVGHEGPGCL